MSDLVELFVELQCEELPAGMVRPALEGLRSGILDLLSGIRHGEATVYATPRRLAVRVDQVAKQKPTVESVINGPPVERAYDLPEGDAPLTERLKDATPTGAAKGFARGRGVNVEDLEVISTSRGFVVAARVQEGGEKTADILSEGLDDIVRGLPFGKSMQWGTGGLRFGRPLHRVNAILGGHVIDGTAGGLTIGNETVGHRLSEDPVFAFGSAEDWLQGLRDRKVEPDLLLREDRIRELLAQAADEHGADPIEDDDLVEEVLHLVEWPVLVVGTFDEVFLELPPRLLVETMKKHQRYFPVSQDGDLTRHFVVIGNNPWGDVHTIAEGNARVLRPRFHDARFFYAEDRKRTLASRRDDLVKMRWIRGLGTMADKQARIAVLAQNLAPRTRAEAENARLGGSLCKSDLTTQMVQEFPTLQGHIGRLYASHDGHPTAACDSIEAHYLPRFADDAVASEPAGIAVALADRLDTLTGCFGIDLKPKGGDPQGLRRAALGLVRTLVENELHAQLPELFHEAATLLHAQAASHWPFEGEAAPYLDRWRKVRGEGQDPANVDALVSELVDFTVARFRANKVRSGLSGDLIDAVLAVSPPDPVVLDKKSEAMRGIADLDGFLPMMHTFKRVLNISEGEDAKAPELDDLSEPAEVALAEAIASVETRVTDAVAELDYGTAIDHIVNLAGPVDRFFEDILVEDPNPAIRARRMGLLVRVARVFLKVADFSRVSTR